MAIVGGGYTGLAAARALARRGADVTVLERHTIGWGASSRNGGFVLPGFKPEIEALARQRGVAEARRLFELSLEAVCALEATIAEERIDCGYARCGTVVLAARPGHLRVLDRSRRFLRNELAHETIVLTPCGAARTRSARVDTTADCSIPSPARSSRPPCFGGSPPRRNGRAPGSLEAVDVCRVARAGGGFTVTTARGAIAAREVLVATNGYTGAAVPALRRRVVPVGSYLIATAPLDAALAGRLIPRRRVLSDTKNLLYYFRLSPDGRMVFGGRAAFTPTPVARSAAILRRGMVEVFPELAGAPVEYAWGGQVAFTMDQMPHAGVLDGIHYALGYGGHGVALANWMGTRMGDALAGAGPMPRLTAPFPAGAAVRRPTVVSAARGRIL